MGKRVSTLERRRRRRRRGGATPSERPREGRERRQEPARVRDPCEVGFRFDPYWDEVFAAYYDPTLGTCCQR